MIEIVKTEYHISLDDYAAVTHLKHAVADLREEARQLGKALKGRKVMMVNSTAAGGGVSEMLPRVVTMMTELGLPTQWAVINTQEERFFALTKMLHNLIHGESAGRPEPDDCALFEAVNRENAKSLAPHLSKDDLLVVHDPQPMALGPMLKDELNLKTVWRCHIGLDDKNVNTRAAWDFLRPYSTGYDRAVFSAPEYIPDYFAGCASIIPPAIDPLAHKNRELDAHKLVGVLCNSGLMAETHPVVTPDFEDRALRLQPSGDFALATNGGDIGVCFRPTVLQVSRWDRLKGWGPLLEAFCRLKRDPKRYAPDERALRRLDIARLVLAGPDPASIQDDPEGKAVLEELIGVYKALDPKLQQDVALVSLPMQSRKHNHLMVNALQRCATVVAQNSLQEGFGLTVTEAMWKRRPVLGSRACGIRQQIRDGIDGRLVEDAENPEEIADKLGTMLADQVIRADLGAHAQRRVHEDFLVFTQVARWIRLLAELANG